MAVDLATGTTLLDRPLERNTRVLLSRGELAIWEGTVPTELVKLERDGSRGEPIYYSPVALTDAAYSPDGEKLALVLAGTGVVVLDRTTNEPVAALNQYEVPVEPNDGSLLTVHWLGDSERLLAGLGDFRDGCWPGHMAMALEGSAEFIPMKACERVSPDGRLMAAPGFAQCLAPGDDTIRLVESFTGRELASHTAEGTLLIPEGWAPDSSEVLVGRVQVPEDVDLDADRCALLGRPEVFESREFVLVDASTFDVSDVDDLDAVYDRWYGEWRIQLVCDEATVQVNWAPGDGGQTLCPDGFSGGTVTVGGTRLAEARGIHVLGFVER
jgi:hypothetical protein